MLANDNPFQINRLLRLQYPRFYIPLLISCFIAAWLVSTKGLAAGIGLIVFPFLILYLTFLFRNAVSWNFWVAILGFIILGTLRYVEVPMIGISIDSVLLLTFLSLLQTLLRKD